MTASGRSGPNWSISRLAIIADPSSMAGRLFGLGVERNEAACGGGHVLAQWPDPPQPLHCVALAARDLACEGLPLLEGLPPDVFLVLELWNVRKQQLVDLPAPETSCWRPRRRCGPDHTPQLPKRQDRRSCRCSLQFHQLRRRRGHSTPRANLVLPSIHRAGST